MRYRGQIGEFKARGFVVALLLCLLFALAVYKRFKFVKETREGDIKATVDATALQVKQLDAEVKLLRAQVASLRDQRNGDKRKK